MKIDKDILTLITHPIIIALAAAGVISLALVIGLSWTKVSTDFTPAETRWRPPFDAFSERCARVQERSSGKSIHSEDGPVCDLYDRVEELETRIAALESNP